MPNCFDEGTGTVLYDTACTCPMPSRARQNDSTLLTIDRDFISTLPCLRDNPPPSFMAHAAQATRLEQCITAKHNQGVPASSSIANFTPPLQEGNTIFCIGGGQKLPLPLVVVRLLSFPRPGAPLIRELYAAECIRCRIEGVLLSILRRQEKYVACLRYFAFRRKTAGFRCNVEVSRAGRTLFGLVKNEPERAGAVGKDTGVETQARQSARQMRPARWRRPRP